MTLDGWASQRARWRWLGALSVAALVFAVERDARALDAEPVPGERCDASGDCETGSLSPPGFSVSVERLFGQARVERRIETAEQTIEESYDVFTLFSDQMPHEGYSSPRLAADYRLPLGLSAGAAIGYQTLRRDGDSSSVWVLAPRLGYFWDFSERVVLWPRAGVTWLWFDGAAEDERAVTLELPLLFIVAEGRLGLSLAPYLELGLPNGDVQLDERGVQVGATVFF